MSQFMIRGWQIMKKSLKRALCLAFAGVWCGSMSPLFGATTIFDNSVNDLSTRFNPGLAQVGDQIKLASTERMITTFSFEYYAINKLGNPNLQGSVQARVRFYLNDGSLFNGYNAPGTGLFDSGWFSVPSVVTARDTFVFNAGSDFPTWGLFVPASEMTWSVQFQGLGSFDEVGLDIYSPPVVGSDYPDYWEVQGGSWTLLTNTLPMNFAAKMDAIVPEPSSAVLWIFGGLGCLLARRLRRTE